jgi:MFS family permease
MGHHRVALAFGSLLPVGARIGDLFGRSPAFLTGLISFAALSTTCPPGSKATTLATSGVLYA